MPTSTDQQFREEIHDVSESLAGFLDRWIDGIEARIGEIGKPLDIALPR